MSKKAKPAWEQRPNESSKAFEAALIYFQMGPARSLERVGQQLGKSKTLMERWSSRYKWKLRAKAWDAHQVELEAAAMEAKAQETAERWADREEQVREKRFRLAEKMLDKADKMLNFPLQQEVVQEDGRTVIIKPIRWTAFSIARLAVSGGILASQAIRNEGAIHNREEERLEFDVRPFGEE